MSRFFWLFRGVCLASVLASITFWSAAIQASDVPDALQQRQVQLSAALKKVREAVVGVSDGMGVGSGEVNPANRDPYKLMLEREQQQRDENERAYNAQMKRLKAQGAAPASSDPWKIVRPASEPAAKR